MRYGSVCSGVEAATVAWHSLGWKPQWFSEIEKFPSDVLQYHYPDVPNLGDMTKFKEWPHDRSIDLLVGGTPCQSFSVAGLRKGLTDPRGNLMLTYLAIAAQYQPNWLVWENVPGVLSSNKGRDFGTFLGALGKLGYGFAYRVLDAQYFGVAQRRRRVFVVGYLGDWRRAAAVLFERESLSGHPAPSRETREDVAPTVTQGAPFSRTGNERVEAEALVTKDGAGQKWPADVASTLNAHYGSKHGLEDQHINGGAPLFVPSKIKNAKTFTEDSKFASTSYSIRDDVTPKASKEITGTLSARDYKGVQAVTVIDRAAYNQGKNALYAPKIEQTELAPTVIAKGPHAVAFGAQNSACQGDSVSEHITPTLDKSKTPAIMTNMHVRRLTPTECERLQGFPDDYTQIPYRNKDAKDCPDGPRYKAMGNSMAVPVMRWIGERIDMVHNLQVPDTTETT